ncbi:chitin binding protein 2 [Orgyia pseudotsugata single capsid nuclopolyhedrovirus]|nr:chitin binding protein 2 [Orgyia pseudotsugata single capsid nuclopolyhedrovirus]
MDKKWIILMCLLVIIIGYFLFSGIYKTKNYRYLKHPYYSDVMYDSLTNSIKLCPIECPYFHQTSQSCKTTGYQPFNPTCYGKIKNIKHTYNCNKYFICLNNMSIMANCATNLKFNEDTQNCIFGSCDQVYCENCCAD